MNHLMIFQLFLLNHINQFYHLNLDTNRFEVRKHLRFVNKYKVKSNWDAISQSDVLDIQQNLSHFSVCTPWSLPL